MLFIVSSVTLGPRAAAARNAGFTPAAAGEAVQPWSIEASPAQGEKCPRCWRIVTEVSAAADSLGLCDRCVDAMTAGGVTG
jgi:isoleucyl-tRNA synthetase